MVREFNLKLRQEILRLIKECRINFHYLVSRGRLNSEGKKIQLRIIKKYVSLSNDKSVLNYIKKDDEQSFVRMLNHIEEILSEPLFEERFFNRRHFVDVDFMSST